MVNKRRNKLSPKKDQVKIKNSNAVNTSTSEGTDLEITISSETEQRLIKKLHDFENNNKYIQPDIKLSGLAHQWNTNTKYLSAIIKQEKKQSFASYINSLRIKFIVHQLENEPKYRSYKVSALAEYCGYSSPQVFVNAFKKEMETTPSQFLEQLKENGDFKD